MNFDPRPPPPQKKDLLNGFSVHFPKDKIIFNIWGVWGLFSCFAQGKLTRKPHLIALRGWGIGEHAHFMQCFTLQRETWPLSLGEKILPQRIFPNLWFAKLMVCNWMSFTKLTGITKTTKTIRTTTNKGVECWIRRKHGNHRDDENHRNPRCKIRVPPKTGLEYPTLMESSIK